MEWEAKIANKFLVRLISKRIKRIKIANFCSSYFANSFVWKDQQAKVISNKEWRK